MINLELSTKVLCLEEGAKKYIFLCRGGGLLFCQKKLDPVRIKCALRKYPLITACVFSQPCDLPASLASFCANGTHSAPWLALCNTLHIDHPSEHSLQRPATFHQKALYCCGAVGIHEVMKCTGEEIVLGKNTGKLPTLSDKVTHRAMHIVSKHI